MTSTISRITDLVGKKLTKIVWDSEAVSFFWEGGSVKFEAEGDCCSHSYITAFDGSEDILDEIVSVEEASMPDTISDSIFEGQEVECLQFYGYRFHTNKASALLEFRNESNGYYGGSLECRGEVK